LVAEDATTFELGVTLIGRRSSCAIQLADVGVSRDHAAVFRRGDDYLVRDLGSRNGTLLNGERVWQSILRPGDIIQVGATKLWCSAADEAPAPMTRDVIVVFLDINGSTAAAEMLGAPFLIAMTQTLERIVNECLMAGGCPVKLLGDGLLAVFGLWGERGAADAALEFARRAIRLAEDVQLPCRLGIARGPIHIPEAFDVLGDTVNVAARLLELAKTYERQLILSDAVVDGLAVRDQVLDLGTVTVRGRTRPITIHTIYPEEPTLDIPLP
jgi:class 3 adenylate cyclase